MSLRINVRLTKEDRQKLTKIIESNQSSQHERLKARVLLLTDVSEHGQKTRYKNIASVAAELQISSRSVGRIKEAYAKNLSIEDVFRFTALSDQKNAMEATNYIGAQKPKTSKKKTAKYVEIDDSESEVFLIENVKCRVTLTKEEREELERVITEGKQSIRKFNRAKILLLADEGLHGPGMTDEEIAHKLDVSMSTVGRVRRLFITKGHLDDVLNFNHERAGRPPKIDGSIQAALVALVCSSPPEGRCKWTVRLLSDKLVALDVVDTISHTAIAKTLKKMNLNLGSEKNG